MSTIKTTCYALTNAQQAVATVVRATKGIAKAQGWEGLTSVSAHPQLVLLAERHFSLFVSLGVNSYTSDHSPISKMVEF